MDKNLQLQQFYQFLLSLNYFTDLREQSTLPNIIEQDQPRHKSLTEQNLFQSVPIRFSSSKNYIALWKKLFYQEAKAQIIRSKTEEISSSEELEFVDFNVLNKFKLLNFKRVNPAKVNYMPSQLVVLSPKKSLKQLHLSYPHLMGIIQPFSQHNIIQIRVILQQSLLSAQNFQLINSSKKWFIQSISSLTTLQRIFKSLTSFDKIDNQLKQLLLRPDLHNKQMEKKFYIPIQLDEQLKKVYNQSQYKAIHQSLKQQGITLIQGPPGTGKTKTVLGTVSVLLGSQVKAQDEDDQILVLKWKKSQQKIKQQNAFNPWLSGNFVDWRDQPYLDNLHSHLNLTKTYMKSQQTDRKIILKNRNQQIDLPGKVLVCGPSNAAVDQIIRKMLTEKLFDKQGKKYLPKFVRIGQNFDPSLTQYSLQQLAIKQCAKKTQTDLISQKIKILKDYKLIFSTLSSIGHQLISSSSISFDTVIIDQAAQSIQLQNLIPLLYQCKRVILIGDPNQLPATIFSKKALQYNYDQSLFQRMMKCDYPVNILRVQYRMNDEISYVVGKWFYGGQLLNGNMNQNDNNKQEQVKNNKKSTTKTSIKQKQQKLQGFIMFHLQNSYEQTSNHSYRNPIESQFINNLTKYLQKSSNNNNNIGILSPYSSQVNFIQSQLPSSSLLQTRTIDSFQGRQKDIIILSTVRSRYISKKMNFNRKRTIGFVSDMRRINVSLSRAKNACIIVGDLKRLCLNNKWKNIIEQAMDKGQVYQIEDVMKDNLIKDWVKDRKKYMMKNIAKEQSH